MTWHLRHTVWLWCNFPHGFLLHSRFVTYFSTNFYGFFILIQPLFTYTFILSCGLYGVHLTWKMKARCCWNYETETVLLPFWCFWSLPSLFISAHYYVMLGRYFVSVKFINILLKCAIQRISSFHHHPTFGRFDFFFFSSFSHFVFIHLFIFLAADSPVAVTQCYKYIYT